VQGKELGPYRILSELGSGGMGTVHAAEVTEAVAGLEAGQRVAVKVIHPHLLATPGFSKRFLWEAWGTEVLLSTWSLVEGSFLRGAQ
jgi:serine/threonine protein kinase